MPVGQVDIGMYVNLKYLDLRTHFGPHIALDFDVIADSFDQSGMQKVHVGQWRRLLAGHVHLPRPRMPSEKLVRLHLRWWYIPQELRCGRDRCC